MSGHLNPGGQQFRDDDGAAEPMIAGFSLALSEQVDLAVRLQVAPGDWRPVVNRAAQGIAGRLAGRLRRGVEFSVTRDPVGS